MENGDKTKNSKMLIPLIGVLVFLLAAVVVVNVLIKVRGGVTEENKTPEKTTVQTEQGNPRVLNPQPVSENTTAPETANVAPQVVTISKLAFNPSVLTVKKGTVVTFKNDDTVDHKVVGTSKKWGSLLVTAPGEAYSQSFEVAGTYDYYCEIHPSMTGKIIVE